MSNRVYVAYTVLAYRDGYHLPAFSVRAETMIQAAEQADIVLGIHDSFTLRRGTR